MSALYAFIAQALGSDCLSENNVPTVKQLCDTGRVMYLLTYSALTKKEIVLHATAWINLENIVLSEISQKQRDKYFMISPM